jgi:predicted esterase
MMTARVTIPRALRALAARRAALAPAGVLAALLPGCVAVYPPMGPRAHGAATLSAAAPARPESPDAGADAADRWPARWGPPDAGPDAPRGVIVASDHPAASLRPAHLGRFHHLRTSETEYRQAEQLAKGLGIDDGFRFEAEGPGSLVFLPPLEDQPPEPAADASGEAELFVYVSGRPTPDSTPDDPRIALERTWIALYDPATPEPRGTILLIPGMLGTPQPIIEGMVRYWRNSGYAVVRFLSHPSRFTERVEVPIAAGEEEAAGRLLAEIYDQRTAECAYAADAALGHVFARREALADKPVVLVGMSGGAMVLPTVYAYAPDRYDAAVLIAGGLNFLRISAESNYADWIDAISLDWDPEDPASVGRPTNERLARVSDAYLAASELDATHTAEDLAGVPVLMLHATKDRAVPSDLGEALWRRLDTPERWVFPVGHELIFMMLPTQAERLTAWIDRAVDAASDNRRGDAAGGGGG